jgi:hypothetical protein
MDLSLSLFTVLRLGDVTIASEGLQTLGLCSALRAFKQGGVFIVPHLLWQGTSAFPVSSEGTLQDLMILESGVRIPLWDVGAGLSDETV